MACDEAIFNLYPYKRIPTLRVYGWQSASITLGYFQKAHEALNLPRVYNEHISFTRRITGGAAILHLDEITYSLSLSPQDLLLPQGVKESYKVLTSFIVNFYRSLGLDAGYACDYSPENLEQYQHFCFDTLECYDILIEGKKIGGNAQKRRKKLIFQQGSIPLVVNFDLVKHLINNTSPDLARKTQGLSYFLKSSPERKTLCRKLHRAFEETFGVTLCPGTLTPEEEELSERLITEKYANPSWNLNYEQAALAQ